MSFTKDGKLEITSNAEMQIELFFFFFLEVYKLIQVINLFLT